MNSCSSQTIKYLIDHLSRPFIFINKKLDTQKSKRNSQITLSSNQKSGSRIPAHYRKWGVEESWGGGTWTPKGRPMLPKLGQWCPQTHSPHGGFDYECIKVESWNILHAEDEHTEQVTERWVQQGIKLPTTKGRKPIGPHVSWEQTQWCQEKPEIQDYFMSSLPIS